MTNKLLSFPILLLFVTIHAPLQSQDKTTVDEATSKISDPWNTKSLLSPKTLKNALSSRQKDSLSIIYVGPPVLYKSGHIAGAISVGMVSDSAGATQLKKELRKIAADKKVILYCGCCPWKNCPNIRPAYTIAQEMGFKNVEVLDLPNNFTLDWAKKGFPVVK